MNATKERIGADDVGELFADAARVVVAKGRKVATLEPGKAGFDPDELRAAVLGPTGNLRAPTIRVGKTWLVGFSDEAYADRLG